MIFFKTRLVLFCEGEGGDGKGGGSNGSQGGGGGDKTPTSIKVGEKTYTIEQIQALETSAGAAAKLVQKAQQYDLDVDSFVSHSEQALGITADLLKQGVIKPDGTIDLSKAQGGGASKDPPGGLFNQGGGRDPDPSSMQTVEAIVSKAMEKIGERLETVERGQSKLFEDRVRSKLKTDHPEFTDDDISYILTESRARRKPLLEVAKSRAGMMGEREKQIREDERGKLAKEYGLDYEELNKQKTLDPDQGAATFTQGKRLSFKKGEGTVTPRDATLAWLKAKGIGG